jgi:hypothetical protein
MTIPLGRLLPSASSDRPGRRSEDRSVGALSGPTGRPYLVLLPVRFAVPSLLPRPRCALTAPFHPYRSANESAVSSLWHCLWGRPRRALPGTVSPWSPDFPLPGEPGSGHPAVWQGRRRLMGRGRQARPIPRSATSFARGSVPAPRPRRPPPGCERRCPCRACRRCGPAASGAGRPRSPSASWRRSGRARRIRSRCS